MKKNSDQNIQDKIRFDIPWEKSKEDIWASQFAQLTASPPVRKQTTLQLWVKYTSVAAAILVLTTISFMWLYTKNIETALAQRETITLPDGSTVMMNAESKISYKPLWWKLNREVKLEGEAFFKVQKGKRFTVVSHSAQTAVLGTSFNIYARKDAYEATCFTGRVRVTSSDKKSAVTITPNCQAVLLNGQMQKKNVNANNYSAWSRHEFYFTSAPLSRVFDEIARQYGVKIECKGDINEQYTGNFSKELSIKEVLNLVCLPFGVNFTAINRNQYLISE